MNQGGFNQDYYNRTDSAADSATPEVRHETVLTDAPFLTGFTSCKSHVIAATEEQTNYPVRIVIHRSSGTDSGQDVYVGASGCLATYADIRFTAADGSTLLDYAFPPDITPDSSSATVDVLVPSLSVGNTTIRIYYGNSDASDASDPDAVYLGYYDHFDSIDPVKWNTGVSEGYAVAGSVLTVTGDGILQSRIGWASDLTKTTVKIKSAGFGWFEEFTVAASNDVLYAFFRYHIDAEPWFKDPSVIVCNDAGGGCAEEVLTGWTAGDWHILELHRAGSGTGVIWTLDGGTPITIASPYPTAGAIIRFAAIASGAYVYVDSVYTRQYSTTVSHGTWTTVEPSHTLPSYTAYYTNETNLYFLNGSVAFTAGENVTGATSGVTGVIREVTLLAGSWAGGTAEGYIIVVGASAPFQHENLTGNLGGTAHTEGRTVSISTYDYSAGSGMFATNETITGATSGATATVVSWTFDSGDFGAGTAAGSVRVIDASPGFLLHESITGSVTAAATLSGGAYTESCPLLTTSLSISKRVGDAVWVARLEMAGTYVAPGDSRCVLYLPDKDTGDSPHCLFSGILADQDYQLQAANNRTSVTGYSDAWYLQKQYMNRDFPLFYFNESLTTTVTPSPGIYMDTTVAPGCETHVDPRLLVTQFIADAGMELGKVSDSTPWADGTIKQSEFNDVGPSNTKWETICAIGEYLDFYFHERFASEKSYADFVSNDDLDTLLSLPSPETFTYPDQYVIGPVRTEKMKGELYNRIVVWGTPTMITDTVTISSTSDQTVSLSQLGVSGTVGMSLNGVDHTSFTENLSGTDVTSISITGLSTTGTAYIYFQPAVTYYESVWEHADIGDGKRVIQAPPYQSNDLVTQEQCDRVCNALQLFYTTDPNVYHATFDRRTDLRLLQLVTLTGFPGIPEDQMRITGITYKQEGIRITVDCEMANEAHLSAQRRLKRLVSIDTAGFVEALIEKRMRAINVLSPGEVRAISQNCAIILDQFQQYKKGTII